MLLKKNEPGEMECQERRRFLWTGSHDGHGENIAFAQSLGIKTWTQETLGSAGHEQSHCNEKVVSRRGGDYEEKGSSVLFPCPVRASASVCRQRGTRQLWSQVLLQSGGTFGELVDGAHYIRKSLPPKYVPGIRLTFFSLRVVVNNRTPSPKWE